MPGKPPVVPADTRPEAAPGDRPAILFDTPFAFTGEGGGQRRASQIAELIDRAGYDVVRLAGEQLFSCKSFRRRCLGGARTVWRSGVRVQRSRHAAKIGVIHALAYHDALAAHTGPRVLVRERLRGFGGLAPVVAHDLGYRTVALPQNFESLVQGQEEPFLRRLRRPAAVADEVARLAREDFVFAISREEQWLLAAHGLPADHLPYYPAARWEAELLKARAARRPVAGRVLVIGSVSNPPVRAGVEAIVRRAAPIVARVGGEIHLAGNDTDQLRDRVPAGVVVHGRVSPAALDDLMATSAAGLAYQSAGCGALTKIPELLLAGVPVLANGVAARSAYHYAGLYLFETDRELAELLSRPFPPPPLPPRPVAAEERFMALLRELAGSAV